MNDLKHGDTRAGAAVNQLALDWHNEFVYHPRFGSKTQASFRGYSKECSLLTLPMYYNDPKVKKALFKEPKGHSQKI